MNTEQQPSLSVLEPVLAVTNVRETVRYWQEILGFPNKWLYTPPVHGGVSWHEASVQFTENPERAKKSVGNAVWIKVKNIDELYRIHQERKADIADGLKNRPWGLDEYWVRDNNGYFLIFSGNSMERQRSGSFPDGIIIVDRKPTVDEYTSLLLSVGWLKEDVDKTLFTLRLRAPIYSAMAIDTTTNEPIGCAMILGDNASFYYVKDVVVRPEWQKMRIGTALMKALQNWLEANGVPGSLVGLYTSEGLEGFYKQFGFGKAFGMVRTL